MHWLIESLLTGLSEKALFIGLVVWPRTSERASCLIPLPTEVPCPCQRFVIFLVVKVVSRIIFCDVIVFVASMVWCSGVDRVLGTTLWKSRIRNLSVALKFQILILESSLEPELTTTTSQQQCSIYTTSTNLFTSVFYVEIVGFIPSLLLAHKKSVKLYFCFGFPCFLSFYFVFPWPEDSTSDNTRRHM